MSGVLLRLQLSLPHFPWRPTNHRRFVALAADEGLEVRPIEIDVAPGVAIDYHALQREIETAQAYWLSDPHLLESPMIRSAIESRLAQGAVMIAEIRWSQEARPGDAFLHDLGLEATSIRASAEPVSSEWSHPMLVAADRHSYELGFRDTTLFKGVGRLLLQQANGIGCFGEAQTILALPAQAIDPIDMRSDYFVLDFPRPELPVMATSARPDWQGRVVALHCGLLHDAYVGPFGATFPGIDAEDNEMFARNLLRLCAGAPRAPNGWEEVYRLVRQLEYALARWTRCVLVKTLGDQWFATGVPEEKRKKCIDRWKQEGSKLPVESYLDLIDFKAILKAHKSAFAPELALSQVTLTGLLAQIQSANDLRKLAVHATKQAFAERAAPTAVEVEAARQACRLVLSATAQR